MYVAICLGGWKTETITGKIAAYVSSNSFNMRLCGNKNESWEGVCCSKEEGHLICIPLS
jgi:hypothetical protein